VPLQLTSDCSDPNAAGVGKDGRPLQKQCECREGFVALNAGSGLTRILRPDTDDLCVPAISSENIDATADILTMTFAGNAELDKDKVTVTRHDADGEVKIDITEKINIVRGISDALLQYVVVTNLRPGFRYTASVDYNDLLVNDINSYAVRELLVVPIVMSCSCAKDSIDKTGRPAGEC